MIHQPVAGVSSPPALDVKKARNPRDEVAIFGISDFTADSIDVTNAFMT